ncbi:MAG: hypothetical protein ACM3JC_01135 [Rudaea sp.]
MPPLDLGNLLQKYMDAAAGNQAPADAPNHFDQVAQQASPEIVSQGIAEALRSEKTPPLGQMVRDIFSNADPQQRAGMLNQILGALGPGVSGSLGGAAGGGVLGKILGQIEGGATPQVTPEQASQVSPSAVQDLANHAEKQDDSIFDRLGSFYAQHPQLVKTLGSAALTIALAKMADRMRS